MPITLWTRNKKGERVQHEVPTMEDLARLTGDVRVGTAMATREENKWANLSEAQMRRNFKKAENLAHAESLGLEVSSKMREKEITTLISEYYRSN